MLNGNQNVHFVTKLTETKRRRGRNTEIIILDNAENVEKC